MSETLLEPVAPGGITLHTASASERTSERLYQRLAWVASGAVAFSILRLGVWGLIVLITGASWRPGPYNTVSALLTAGLGAVVVYLCLRARPGGEWFAWIAVPYQVITAIALGAGLMGWQRLVTAEVMDSWFETRREAPWSLGAGEVAWVGVWVLLFAIVVPLAPKVQLLAGLLSISSLAAWTMLSLAVYPSPPGVENLMEELGVAVIGQLLLGALLCVLIGYWAARQMQQMDRRLAAAREMGSYRLSELLGKGGMGEVWKGQHRMLARPAAIKLIRPADGGSDARRTHTLLERFEREVQATSQLHSPHTIQVYDYGFASDGVFYYAMELLDGLDLEELVLDDGPQSPQRVVYMLRQACQSLAEAHSRGLVHRDIKPANIMLCRVGLELDFVKLLDFGLVKSRAMEGTAPALTQELTFAGTPAFAAPEVAQHGALKATPASDLYSLGCVAFWLLTGRHVFVTDTPVETLSKHISGQPELPSSVIGQALPEQLEQLIMRCLAKKPENRPASAAALANELAECPVPGSWDQTMAREWWAGHRPRPGEHEMAEAPTEMV